MSLEVPPRLIEQLRRHRKKTREADHEAIALAERNLNDALDQLSKRAGVNRTGPMSWFRRLFAAGAYEPDWSVMRGVYESELRKLRLGIELEERHDAFRVGNAHSRSSHELYLTADGRLFLLINLEAEPREVLGDQRFVEILRVSTSRPREIDLMELLPHRPPGATDCAKCGGTRWFRAHDADCVCCATLPCDACSGKGWSAVPASSPPQLSITRS